MTDCQRLSSLSGQTNHWFRITLKIPAAWKDYERVQCTSAPPSAAPRGVSSDLPCPLCAVEFDSSSEAMIIDASGLPLQGITGGFGVDRRVEFIVPPAGRKAGTYEFYVEASCVGVKEGVKGGKKA